MATKSKIKCTECEGTEFILREGRYYCTNCQLMTQQMVEFDTEQVNARGKIRKPPAEKKQVKEKKKSSKFFENGVDVEVVKHWTSHHSSDYPIHLRQSGRRITTFTRLVALWVERMITNFDVPETIKDASFFVVQKYFAFYGIAFDENAISDGNRLNYRWKVKKTELQARQKRAEREARLELKKKKEDLEKSRLEDVMMFVTQTNQDENEEFEASMRMDVVTEKAALKGTVFDTAEAGLSLTAANLTARMYLEIDMVIAVIFVSCQMVGASWITLSDVSRWFREDRLEATAAQISGLGMAPDKGEDKLDEYQKRLFTTPTGSLSLSELFYPVILLSHTSLPPSMPTLEFSELLDRFLWHLNLPVVFKHRLDAILDSIFEPICDVGQDYLDEICPFQPNFPDSISKTKQLSYSTFFKHVFLINSKHHQEFLTSEVKAMAVILFGLKLMFGIDGKREFNMKNDETGPTISNFNLSEWKLQLRLRLAVWKGMSVKNVLDKKYVFDDQIFKYKNANGRVGQTSEGRDSNRSLNFVGAVPRRPKNAVKDRMFHRLFKSDFSENPRNNNSDEALFAPMKSHGTQTAEWRMMDSEDKEWIDKEKERIFFADFTDLEMDYKVNDKLEEGLKKAEKNGKPNKDAAKWNHLFPCLTNYLFYPQPKFLNNLMAKDGVIYSVMIQEYNKRMFDDMKRFMPNELLQLLEIFAQIIGEQPHLLFLALSMVETMFLKKHEIKNMEKAMKKGKGVLAHFHRGNCQTKGLLFVKESLRNGNKRKFKYEIEFGKKLERSSRLFNPNSEMESDDEDELANLSAESMEVVQEARGAVVDDQHSVAKKDETSKRMGNQEVLKLESTFALALLIWRFW